jgi:hypothetical protein
MGAGASTASRVLQSSLLAGDGGLGTETGEGWLTGLGTETGEGWLTGLGTEAVDD